MARKFITIEGTDGSGKKTQIRLLADYLRAKGNQVFIQSFPNYESLSSAPVKMYLGGEVGDDPNCLSAYQATVLYAADRVITMTQLLKYLPEDCIVLFDRYVQSGYMHQAGKIKNAKKRAAFIKWNEKFEFDILKLPRPDKVIFIDMPAEMSLKLIESRGQLKIGECFDKDIHEKNREHLISAYNTAKEIANAQGWVEINCLNENGTLKTIEEIHKIIVKESGL
ncbi:MAG: deoxynucleoside kinase [Christensenellaceae bacterium]|jgi:dTMP kinase|nr:deoxynucleoside kinase [Christensenellaceae bacterium]